MLTFTQTIVNDMKHRLTSLSALAGTFVLLVSSCASLSKAPKLKNTCWTARHDIFVADAGTMTSNYTLKFTSGKDYVFKEEWSMPPHPSTYVNPEGGIDMIPGSSGESEDTGTWTFSHGILTLVSKDGRTRHLRWDDGKFALKEYDGTIVFEKIKDAK
jgi:hypothetical protein